MQIGQDRGGFYSYTIFENDFGADMPKVEHLVPDWKPRAVGETVWFATPKRFGGQGKMIPAIVEPNRAFAMVSPNDWQRLQAGGRAQEGMWTFTSRTAGRRPDSPDRSRARRHTSDAHIPISRQTFLGTRSFRDGAEDASHDSRLVGAAR